MISTCICSRFTAEDVSRLGECLSTVCRVEPSASALDGLGGGAPVSLHALHCLDTVHKVGCDIWTRGLTCASWLGAVLSLSLSLSFFRLSQSTAEHGAPHPAPTDNPMWNRYGSKT